jgi:hypothetical protein
MLLQFSAMAILLGTVGSKTNAQSTNVTTGHQDIPSTICSGTGCVYRTGQNLQESTLTYLNLSKSTLGQFCNYTTLDGQVYAQPLVVTNVKWTDGLTHKIVYVMTMNGSVYAFDGTPTAPTGYPVPSCTKLVGRVPQVSVLLRDLGEDHIRDA